MNLFDLFATINLDPSGYEKGLEDASEKTQSFKSKLQTGISNAAKIATTAITTVSAAGTALAGVMVKNASSLASYGDNIDKASQKMGISAQAYQEWDAILQHSGSSIDGMTRALVGLQTKVEAGSDAFQKLGLSQKEVAAMSTEELFASVITGLQSMEEGSERTTLAQELLGNAVKELGPLLNTSAEETEAMRQRVHQLGGVLSDEAVKSSAAFQDNLQDLKTAFSGIKNGIASDMLPGLTNLMKGFTSLIVGEEGAEEALQGGFDAVLDSITSGIEKVATVGRKIVPALVSSIVKALPSLAGSVVEIFTVIGETLVDNAPMLLSSVMEIATAIGNSIIENLPIITAQVSQAMSNIALMLSDPETLSAMLVSVMTIIQTVGTSIIENVPILTETVFQVINNVVDFVTDNLPVFIDMAMQIITSLSNGLIDALPRLLEKIPVIIDRMTTAILNLLPKIVQTGITLLTALVTALPQIINTIVKAVPQIVNSIVNSFSTLVPALVDAGILLFTALIDAMPEILDAIVDALPVIIDSIVNGLLNMLPKLVDAGVKLLTALVQNLPKIISTIVSKLPQIITSIVNALVSYIPKIVNVGSQLIQGLWKGISNVGEWLRQKISGFFGGVVDSIKKFFGISSPSKVFAGIGEMLDRGLAKGVGDYAKLAVNAAEDMADDVFSATDRDFNFTASADMDKGTAIGRKEIVINVYGAEGQDVNELAEIISQKIAFGFTQEQAVFA